MQQQLHPNILVAGHRTSEVTGKGHLNCFSFWSIVLNGRRERFSDLLKFPMRPMHPIFRGEKSTCSQPVLQRVRRSPVPPQITYSCSEGWSMGPITQINCTVPILKGQYKNLSHICHPCSVDSLILSSCHILHSVMAQEGLLRAMWIHIHLFINFPGHYSYQVWW